MMFEEAAKPSTLSYSFAGFLGFKNEGGTARDNDRGLCI